MNIIITRFIYYINYIINKNLPKIKNYYMILIPSYNSNAIKL